MVVCTISVGCGRPTTIVTGVVTLDGQPVAEAHIDFFPIEKKGQTSGTVSDGYGRYRAAVSPVAMRVTVIKRRVAGYKAVAPDVSYSREPIVEDLLPVQYGNPDTSPLTVDPAKDRATTFDIAIPAITIKN